MRGVIGGSGEQWILRVRHASPDANLKKDRHRYAVSIL
jgi:hypothetical protein